MAVACLVKSKVVIRYRFHYLKVMGLLHLWDSAVFCHLRLMGLSDLASEMAY